ncbi:MAG TPA: GPGG-motif small membrane protein, partial [Ilumatobacteraceae bacterium]|nr:GPGG-motif small membrane protein [Ilumatobacteraceae bacterium]
RVRLTTHKPNTLEVRDMEFLLWILAVILVISGIVALTRKEFAWGAVLIIVGLLVGPGGVSVFT